MSTSVQKYRIESIDLLRGVVMVLMALDHTRDFFGSGTFFSEPTDLSTTTPLLFLTRWITHFCAPVFVFLAGTSAFLYGTRRESIKEVSWFLFTRGIWLIIVEVVINRFGWTFDITFSTITLQVLWAIGASMVFLSALVFLPRLLIFSIGIVLVFGHNLLDFAGSFFGQGYSDSFVQEWTTVARFIWSVLHQPNYVVLGPDFGINIAYPLIPWIGVMALGYVFGTLYHKVYDAGKRKSRLLWMGIGATSLFLLLRAFNLYGDPSPWSTQKSSIFSIMSFANTTKYPPSLLFLLMTLGPSFLFLYWTENVKNRVTDSLIIIGRVPFFFYVIHIYVIHLLALLGLVYAGRSWTEYILTSKSFMAGTLADFGFSLVVVYLIWLLVVALLFPICKWYNDYKTNHREKWWLGYL
jgi:uncharacterized membrane protein